MQSKSWCGAVLVLQHFTVLLKESSTVIYVCEANFKLSCIVKDVTAFMPKDGVQSFSLGTLDKWTYLHSHVCPCDTLTCLTPPE